VAFPARICDSESRTAASRARQREEALCDIPGPAAVLADGRRFPIVRSIAAAFVARLSRRNGNRFADSVDGFGERNAEDLLKCKLSVGRATGVALESEWRVTGQLLVVLAPLIVIPQNVIRRIHCRQDFVAFIFCGWSFEGIRVVSTNKFVMRILDFIWCGSLLQTEPFVEVLGLPIDLRFRSSEEAKKGLWARDHALRRTIAAKTIKRLPYRHRPFDQLFPILSVRPAPMDSAIRLTFK
jgi:hypothetical protein